jgi:NitT/TauT family transport system substrate-binding protein
MTIVLQETQRALFYAPFYAALALGAYRDEGLDVALKVSSQPEDAVRSVVGGAVDVSWGGPMRVIVAHDQNPTSDLVCFCEVVTRDPFLLIGRMPCVDFTLTKLLGARLGVVREVPTPWCCLQEDMYRAGLDPQNIDARLDRTMAENTVALRSGQLDVIQVLEPFAQKLLAEGAGHVWYAAADRGPTSYTSFYTRRSVLDARRTEFGAMTRAVYRTQKWLDAASTVDTVGAIIDYFPDVPRDRLTAAIANYRRLGIWGKTPHLPRSGYERLRASLLASSLVSTGITFEDAVDNAMADEAVAMDPPALSPSFQ